MKETSEYDKQANDFLVAHNVSIGTVYEGHRKYFPDDPTPRAVFRVTIEREGFKPYTFTFGQSLVDSYEGSEVYPAKGTKNDWRRLPMSFNYDRDYSKPEIILPGKPGNLWRVRQAQHAPTAYDILAVVTKSDPGDFEEFCSDFGYNTDSKKDTELYLSVVKEWKNIERLFGDCLDELQEIN